MFVSARRFARLGTSLAAGAAAATMVHLASDERKRKSRCSAAAAGAPATGVSKVVGELEKQEEHRGAGKRSRPARKVTNQVSGTAAQRAFFTKEMTVMGLPLRASEAVADSALVSHRPRHHTPPTPPTPPTHACACARACARSPTHHSLAAQYVAADRISRMLREQPASVLERLALCGARFRDQDVPRFVTRRQHAPCQCTSHIAAADERDFPIVHN